MDFSNKKSLVVYYSKTGEQYFNSSIQVIEEGNTKKFADIIKNYIHADWFEVVPLNDYPEGYQITTEIAKEELNSNARPELKTYLEDVSDYDIIFIGFPNWWGTMPMVVNTFLERYDLKDKKIIPFVTHEGSGFGRSVQDLKKVCKDSIILEGLAITGSIVGKSREGIIDWLDHL